MRSHNRIVKLLLLQ